MESVEIGAIGMGTCTVIKTDGHLSFDRHMKSRTFVRLFSAREIRCASLLPWFFLNKTSSNIVPRSELETVGP